MNESNSGSKQTIADRLDWTIFRKPSVISVFLLVALWNISVSSNLLTRALEGKGAVRETARAIRDINISLQLRFYQLLTRRRSISLQPYNVSLAIIDDDTHWTALFGDQPTSRAYLARLITNASQPTTKAAAIGLDIELLAPRGFPEGGDAQTRFKDNQALLDSVRSAICRGVPIILGGVYYEHPYGIPDLHHTEVDRETRQLIADELCVVYFFPDADQYRVAIIPRASIVREHLEDKLGYKIKSASKNRKFIKGFLVDL